MVKKIKWNKAANNTFEETTNYLQDNFELKAAESFANLITSLIK